MAEPKTTIAEGIKLAYEASAVVDEIKDDFEDIKNQLLIYGYFYHDANEDIILPVNKTSYNLLEFSSKGISDSETKAILNPSSVYDIPNGGHIFGGSSDPITLYQTGNFSDMATTKYGYDTFDVASASVWRYCIPITLGQLFEMFPSNYWSWTSAGNGRLLLRIDSLISKGLYCENGFVLKAENAHDLQYYGLSNVNFAIGNLKVDQSITNKATAIAALTGDDYADTLIIFKKVLPTIEQTGITVEQKSLFCDGVTAVGIHGFAGCLKASYLSLGALIYSKEQIDEKFLTKDEFNADDHIEKIGEMEAYNNIYAGLRSLGFPKYASATFVAPTDTDRPSDPFRGYSFLINQRIGDAYPFSYGYFVLSEGKAYWLTEGENGDVVSYFSNLTRGEGENSIQQTSAQGTVNFAGRNQNAEEIDETLSDEFSAGAQALGSSAFGKQTIVLGINSMANGNKSLAKGEESHAEGYCSVTLGDGSHAEGATTVAAGVSSHSEGDNTQALGDSSHSEGHTTIAGGLASHAEGAQNKIGDYAQGSAGADQIVGGTSNDTPPTIPYVATVGEGSHSEGIQNIVRGYYSHAEGALNYITGHRSHAEGIHNTISGNYSHAEGYNNIVSSDCSLAAGTWNENSGYGAAVFGAHNENSNENALVAGQYNDNETDDLFEVGNGTGDNARSNAFVVRKNGTAAVGANPVANMDVATKGYVDSQIGDMTIVLHYCGSVQSYDDLESISNPRVGDVYNVIESGKNYAWSGTDWDDLGGTVDLSGYYDKTEIDEMFSDIDVIGEQAMVAIVTDATTNINGRVLSSFIATPTTIGGYPAIVIKYSDDSIITEEQAERYMKAQTGSSYVPKYDYNNPANSYIMFADKTLWKPQYDSTNGLVLFSMNSTILDAESAQVITGQKAFETDIYLGAGSTRARVGANNDGDLLLRGQGGSIWFYNNIKAANNVDIGASSYKFKDLYLSGSIKLSDPTNTYNWSQESDGGDGVNISRNGVAMYSYGYSNFRPAANNQRDLGNSGQKWKDLYLSGNISDGTNSISVASIASKSTVSGTNDGTSWTSLTIDGVTYDLSAGGSGTNVIANPTLEGEESDLTALQVAGTKYRVPQFEIQSNLKGKKLSLIGDSITTYSGYLPSGNATRYPRGAITNVNQTWWKQLIDQTGMVLGQNCAWDGSTCIGRSTSTTNAYGACSAKRISQLGLNGNPDIIICFIGINDWGATYNQTGSKYGSPFVNGAFVPVGSYTGETAAPSGDLQTFSEAYGSMLYNIQVNYPNAKIYCCTLLQTNGKSTYNYDADGAFPSINRDGVTLAAYNECIRTLAKNIGAEVIEFAKCGINWGNMSTYLEDGLHPNVAGMRLLCASAKAKLEADFGYTTESFTPLQTFSVTNNLTNVANSNNATTASENTTYSASLTADTGYTISNVAITMGGTDITSSAYSGGVISIGNVTGNIVITASATLNVYSITNSLTNVTNSNQATTINHGNSYSATLTMPSGYNMQSVYIQMGGVDITSSVYSNNDINIPSVTGNIVITAIATNQVTYPITNNLSNATTSNASVSIVQGNSYSATLTPSTHYELKTANVSVSMGGTDVTGTVYDGSNRTISIPSVTGALVINATATIITHTITNTLTHTTNSNNAVSANDGSSYSGTLTADTGYNISSVSVTMGGVDITSTAYSNGVITISSVTGDIVIQCVSTAVTYSITNNLTNATSDNSASTIGYGSSYSATITADSGYVIASATVTMGGVDITNTVYDNDVISIPSVTGNLVITITAVNPSAITWYTNFSQTSTNSFVAASRGWALDETTYANIYNKPINRISLVATASSGSIDLCVAPRKNAQSGFTQQQTINWTSANKVGNIVTLELPTAITLASGEYLCVYVASTPANGVACYASGGNAGQFYSYVGASGHGSWGNKGSYSIQMNIGYLPVL